jgi:hypothetical protein
MENIRSFLKEEVTGIELQPGKSLRNISKYYLNPSIENKTLH